MLGLFIIIYILDLRDAILNGFGQLVFVYVACRESYNMLYRFINIRNLITKFYTVLLLAILVILVF